MDAVITYVDGSRERWRKQYAESVGGRPSVTRYRDWGTLRYTLRGIQKNAPFIRNVYLVVSDEDQVPEWVNRKNLRIVTHRDIIPAKLLPTFSSNVIELWLHAVPGLQEEFVYFNDDVFLLNRCRPEDFFVNGKPCLTPRKLTERGSMFRDMICNSTNTARAILGLSEEPWFLMQRHTVAPMTRRSYEYAYEKAGERIFASFTPTRKSRNLNDYIFMDLNYLAGKYHPARIDFQYFRLAAETAGEISSFIRTSKVKTICINDGCEPDRFESVRDEIHKAFKARFPAKSKYEL